MTNSLATGDTVQVAIGTSPGATNILSWTDAASGYAASGLALTVGNTYFGSVRIKNDQGKVISSANGDGWKVVATVSNVARYSIAQNWNQYAVTATPTSACLGTENGYYLCLHGGESRKVAYPAAAACAGYTIVDSLGAFDWACDETGGAGNVFFYSRRLKKSKGLKDLVDATSWKLNRVAISQGGTVVAASARSAWWTNTVMALPPSMTIGAYTTVTSSTIYTVASNMTVLGGYAAASAQGAAFVTLGTAVLNLDGTADPGTVLFNGAAGTAKFNWLEGDFTTTLSNSNLYNTLGNQSVVRRVRSIGFGWGIGDSGIISYANWISQVFVSLGGGARLKGSFNLIQDLTVIGSNSGFTIGDLSNDNVFQNILVANNTYAGLYLYSGYRNTFLGVTAINNGSWGVASAGNTDTTWNNVFARNNNNLSTNFTNGTKETYGQLVTDYVRVYNMTTVKFTSNLVMINAANNCDPMISTNPGITATCGLQGTSDFSYIRNTTKGDTSFVGQISTPDLTNATNSNGTFPYSANIDWMRFSNPLRGWGRGGTYPSPSTLLQCTTGTCQIWDFTLKSSDSELRNVTGDGTSQNASFVNGAACPAAISGTVFSVNNATASKTYLTNAAEVMGSGGNNNGLCESNETCVYFPNYGAYQGSGDFRTSTCTFSNGTVTGVTMFAYPTN